MKKIFILAASLLLFSSAAFAQEVTVAKKGNHMTPSKGDFSIGFTFNPVALSKKLSYQPSVGTFVGDWIGAQAEYPHEMFFLSTDPLASLMMKYRFTDHWGIRANIGFTGSRTNYKEYIQDDYAVKISKENAEGGFSHTQAVDVITAKLNAMTIGISAEYTKNFGALSFVAGFGIQYALGGGSMSFKYGNDFIYDVGGTRWINYTPTTTSYTFMKTGDLQKVTFNEYANEDENKYDYYGFDTKKLSDSANVRPTDRYNIGYCNGIGFTCDMGIEWFFAGRMSLTAAITFTPLMILFQPPTYATFEGLQAYDVTYNNDGTMNKRNERSTSDYEVVTFDHPVSPGSTALLYGTENLGFRIGFNYYL